MTAMLTERGRAVPDDDERITREVAAARLGVSLATLDRYLADGLLTKEKNEITRRVTLSGSEVDDLARRRKG